MKKLFLIFCMTLIFICCKGQNCNELPIQFSNYSVAVKSVEAAKFRLSDAMDTSKSSWIREAKYFSCDERTGFLVVATDEKTYIHSKVPLDLWNKFKTSASFGRFYNSYLKNKYHLNFTY